MHWRRTDRALLCVGMTVLALTIGPGNSFAQALDNNTFDTDVSGWTPAADSTLTWDPLDAQADPTSGSALVTNRSNTEVESTGSYQCTDGILEARNYAINAETYIPGVQTASGLVNIVVLWFAEPGCSTLLDLALTSNVLTATSDSWLPISGWLNAPVGTQSARIQLSVLKEEDTGSLAAHFDNVSFAEGIFADGFETGDTGAWSGTVVPTGAPIADFTFIANGLSVQFQNQTTGDQPLSYLWDFGDGTTPPNRTDTNPTHAYSNPGTYNVKLTATNAVGTDSVVKQVTVSQ